MKRKSFTLIEILVALSIVSIGLIALIKAQSQQAQNISHLEQKTIANIVTSNLAFENRLKKITHSDLVTAATFWVIALGIGRVM